MWFLHIFSCLILKDFEDCAFTAILYDLNVKPVGILGLFLVKEGKKLKLQQLNVLWLQSLFFLKLLLCLKQKVNKLLTWHIMQFTK